MSAKTPGAEGQFPKLIGIFCITTSTTNLVRAAFQTAHNPLAIGTMNFLFTQRPLKGRVDQSPGRLMSLPIDGRCRTGPESIEVISWALGPRGAKFPRVTDHLMKSLSCSTSPHHRKGLSDSSFRDSHCRCRRPPFVSPLGNLVSGEKTSTPTPRPLSRINKSILDRLTYPKLMLSSIPFRGGGSAGNSQCGARFKPNRAGQ